MGPVSPGQVVHLELHTGDQPGARDFYVGLFGWRPEQVTTPFGSYLIMEPGIGPGGGATGIVQCPTERPLWLPYVQVSQISAATERARMLGARVLLEPREGPAGWRSVVAAPAGGEVALWQRKR